MLSDYVALSFYVVNRPVHHIEGRGYIVAIALPYSRKIWREIKFGSLAVYNITTAKLKFAKIFLLAYNIRSI